MIMKLKRLAPGAMIFYWLKDFALTFEQLDEALQRFMFKGCSGDAISSSGFVHALDRENALIGSELESSPIKSVAHHINADGAKAYLVSLLIEEKVLPPDEIARRTKARATAIEMKERRIVRPGERKELQMAIKIEMAKDAFSKFKRIDGLILPDLGMLVVFTGAGDSADVFTSMIRKAIGSLKCIPAEFVEHDNDKSVDFDRVMAHLVNTCCDAYPFELGGGISLDGDGKISYKDIDIDARIQNIQDELADGGRVASLEINIPGVCSFSTSDLNVLKKVHWASTFSDADDIEGSVPINNEEEDSPQAQKIREIQISSQVHDADSYLIVDAILTIKRRYFDSIGRPSTAKLDKVQGEDLQGGQNGCEK